MLKDLIKNLNSNNLSEMQMFLAAKLAEELDIASEDKWNIFLDEDDDICIEALSSDKDLKFIITDGVREHSVPPFIIFVKMDRREYPPISWSGFDPNESTILDLLSWYSK
jgi:hypothetical protein